MILHENEYDHLIYKYATHDNLSFAWTKAQIRQESNFNPLAENKSSHAKGLMQFMDKTWLEWEDETPGIQNKFKDYDPFNPEDSIRVGCTYMKWLLGRFRGDINLALASYNWGIGNIMKLRGKLSYFDIEKKLPKETQDYVKRITGYTKIYQQQFEKEYLNK
jgi:soluble lytic murein transglycosylase-like protein